MPCPFTERGANMINQAEYITKALNGKWYGKYGIAFCPCHNNTRTPALSLSQNDNKLLVYCHAGCDSINILRALGRRGFLHDTSHLFEYQNHNKSVKRPIQKQVRDYKPFMQSIIAQSSPIESMLAEYYLRKIRGIHCTLSPNLKYHKSLYHSPTRKYYPAMIGLVTDFHNQ
jgi:hypothetical protein